MVKIGQLPSGGDRSPTYRKEADLLIAEGFIESSLLRWILRT